MATDTASGLSLRTETLTPLHWVGIAMAVVTAVIHVFLGVSFIASPMGWSFLFAAAGFFAGAVAVAVDYRRPLVYLLGIPFTAGQIVLWYVVNAPDFSAIGYGDKAAQLVLIAVLVVLYSRES